MYLHIFCKFNYFTRWELFTIAVSLLIVVTCWLAFRKLKFNCSSCLKSGFSKENEHMSDWTHVCAQTCICIYVYVLFTQRIWQEKDADCIHAWWPFNNPCPEKWNSFISSGWVPVFIILASLVVIHYHNNLFHHRILSSWPYWIVGLFPRRKKSIARKIFIVA